MDYADKVSAFMADYDENKNSFYQKQSQLSQVGSMTEKAGEEDEGIGVVLGGIGYKITSKMGANAIAEKAVGQAVQKGTQVLKQKAGAAYENAKSYLKNKFSPDDPEMDAQTGILDGDEEAGDALGAAGLGDTTAVVPEVIAVAPEVTATVGATAGEIVGAVATEAIPVIGTIAAIIAGIVAIVKGHHEEKNNNASFQMPSANIDLPAYNPGL